MELKILQEQLHCLLNKDIENKIRILRQKEFEDANKSGRFLAWQLKKRREKKIIMKITVRNQTITEQKGIKKAFWEYYTNLFEKEGNNEEQIKLFLWKAKLQKVPGKIKELLNEEISTEEIYEAITATKIAKAPGPDGLIASFFSVQRTFNSLFRGNNE